MAAKTSGCGYAETWQRQRYLAHALLEYALPITCFALPAYALPVRALPGTCVSWHLRCRHRRYLAHALQTYTTHVQNIMLQFK